MQIDVISLFPEIFDALKVGIVGRAQQKKLLQLTIYPLPHYIDDRPYGGGPGMVMQYKPLAKAITQVKTMDKKPTHLIYLSPQGKTLNQASLLRFSKKPRLTLLCGRYEGIDERIIDEFVDEECSMGDYVVSGGELPALLLIDAITRLLPDALHHEESAQQDSFTHGLLDYPHYTRPETINQRSVPSVLLSGNHAAIQRWRQQQALGKTWQKRPDLLKRRTLNAEEQLLLNEYIKEVQKTED